MVVAHHRRCRCRCCRRPLALSRAPQAESDLAPAATAATDVSATAGDGGVNGKVGKRKEPVEWGVYLRTPEDEERTKREWEKEHREWIEDQVRNKGEGEGKGSGF